jgi:hypothetical protein
MVKFCNGPCKLEKSFADFHKGNGKFGLSSRCIECKKSYAPRSKEYKREYYRNNLDKARESRRRHQENHREDYRRRNSAYDKLHKPERAAREACRRAMKLRATPPWLTKEHMTEMKSLYIKRDELRLKNGIIYHVDHIVPLVSDAVCGLHVPWNLQVIPAIDNLKKGNKV